MRTGRQGLEELGHQLHIHHGCFVRYQEIAIERIRDIPGKAGVLVFEKAVDGFGLETSAFGEALRSAARWGAEEALDLLRAKQGENGIHQSRFADARPACDHQDARAKSPAQGLGLAGSQIDGFFLLQPGDRLLGIDLGIFRLAARQSGKTRCDLDFGTPDRREKNQILTGYAILLQFALGKHL